MKTRPLLVSPSPQVLKAIRAQMKERGLSEKDRRLPSVARALAAQPLNVPGLNEGVFYPEEDLPEFVAGLAPSQAMRERPTTGTLRCLVVLVDFVDNPSTRAADEIREMLFSRGTYHTGSMRDFYKENSYGKLDLDGHVVGWLRMPQPYAYYVAENNGTGEYPHNAQKLVEDVLALAAQKIDFATLDSDGDAFLDGLFVVHAGGGAEAEPDPTLRARKIWSHQWNLPQPLEAKGVKAYAYCTEPEDGRVGVFCHEFGHMLGLPDLYDTTYKSEGVGVWCVMGAGSWNNGGDTPGHFCAWSKMKLGWLKPTVVRKSRTLKIAPVENTAQAFRVWTKGKSDDEYFLIENRERVGFDSKLPRAGLLIWHVDDTEHNNNHPGNYWVGLKQADGRYDLEENRNRGDGGDPYPGTRHRTRFDRASKPNSNDRFGNPTGIAVTNIATSGQVVECKVKV